MRTAADSRAHSGNSNIGTRTLKQKKPSGPQRPSPVSAIAKIGLMKRFYNPDVALDMLHELARLVGPLMHRHLFKVGVLCEFYPKNASLLGLNVNRGAKIMLRLRNPGSDLFLPMNDIVGTLLHELTHNLYGAHDAKFYKFLDQLKDEYTNIHILGLGPSASEYVCEENKLGHNTGRLPSSNYVSIRDKRLKAVTKTTYNSERRKLGSSVGVSKTSAPKPGSAGFRGAILAATERRIADSKWCSDHLELDEDAISDADLVTVVDLTNNEYDELALKTASREIIVIDGCEVGNKFSPTETNEDNDEITSPLEAPVTQLLEPFESSASEPLSTAEEEKTDSENLDDHTPLYHREPVGYLVSVSPSRSFFNEGIIYPRRKYVANLTFEEIIRRSREIEIHLLERQEQLELETPSENISSTTYVISRPSKFKCKQTPPNGRFEKVAKKARPTPSRTLHKSLRKPSPAPEPQSHAKTV